MEDPLALATLLADAALDAWQDVQGQEDRHETVAMGADGTPTTRADQVLDDAVLAVASEVGLSVLSEEAGLVDHGSDLVAVVDPLDGSRNAGRGIPLHCTSIAIGRRDLLGVEAAAVQNLVTAQLYTARRGQGAWEDGRRVEQRPFDPEEVMVGVIVDYSEDEVELVRRHTGHHVRDLGSAALELCLVGTSALDAFVVHKPWLRVVDVAAGTLFVREAGGIVLDPATGSDLATPFDLEPRSGIVAAHSPQALEAVR